MPPTGRAESTAFRNNGPKLTDTPSSITSTSSNCLALKASARRSGPSNGGHHDCVNPDQLEQMKHTRSGTPDRPRLTGRSLTAWTVVNSPATSKGREYDGIAIAVGSVRHRRVAGTSIPSIGVQAAPWSTGRADHLRLTVTGIWPPPFAPIRMAPAVAIGVFRMLAWLSFCSLLSHLPIMGLLMIWSLRLQPASSTAGSDTLITPDTASCTMPEAHSAEISCLLHIPGDFRFIESQAEWRGMP